jgi:hypothetical protein
MGENTFRYQSGNAAATYWRRRFVSLVIGLSALALVAWALSSALSASTDGGLAGAGHGKAGPGSAHGAGRSGVTGGDGGSGGGRADRGGSAGQPQRAGGTSSAQPSSHQSGAAPHPAPSTPAHYPGVRPAFCSRSDIVLSLVAGQTDFASQQSPSFGVEVVSTQQSACSFNVGPSYLALVIKEGPVRVWSSADCVTGSGSLVSALKRGVPTVLPLTWDLKTSAPGCGGPVTRVPAGAYTAYAVQGGLVSAPLAFRVG